MDAVEFACQYCRRPPGDTPTCAGCGAPQPFWISPWQAAQYEADRLAFENGEPDLYADEIEEYLAGLREAEELARFPWLW